MGLIHRMVVLARSSGFGDGGKYTQRESRMSGEGGPMGEVVKGVGGIGGASDLRGYLMGVVV